MDNEVLSVLDAIEKMRSMVMRCETLLENIYSPSGRFGDPGLFVLLTSMVDLTMARLLFNIPTNFAYLETRSPLFGDLIGAMRSYLL